MIFQESDRVKIPTELSYCPKASPGGKTSYIWGSDVGGANGCSATPYRFFKLLLESFASSSADPPNAQAAGNCKDGESISPPKLLIDFLSAMREEFMDNIVQKYASKHGKEDFRIDWVFTIPGFFDATLVGALIEDYLPKAGFKGPVTTSIKHMLEPEAAAVRILSQSILGTNHGGIFKVRIHWQ